MASSSLQPSSSNGRPLPADLFAGVRYFINLDVDQATQRDVSMRRERTDGHRHSTFLTDIMICLTSIDSTLQIRSLLSQGGAQEHDDRSVPSSSHLDIDSAGTRFQLDTVTHVLSNSVDFPEYQQCIEPTLLEQNPASKRPLVVTVSICAAASA